MVIKVNNFTIKIAALVLCCLLVSELNARPIDRANFTHIITIKAYVDKTMMIQDFMNLQKPKIKVITAPVMFGKSMTIDMIKKFLSIPVDLNGNVISELNATENYKTFCEPKLKICENETFVKEHMGQYPVLYIDLHPLVIIENFKQLITYLHTVIIDTFYEHRYLLNSNKIFADESEKIFFANHYRFGLPGNLTAPVVMRSFHYLSRLLYLHFGKKVIVLLDEFDSYCSQLLLERVRDRIQISQFLQDMMDYVFKDNDYLDRALLAGQMPVKGIGVFYRGKNVKLYRWLGGHEFSKYYGFTQEEVSTLAKKFAKDKKDINKIQNEVDTYYNGYRTINNNITIYNSWSLVRYFMSKMKARTYWRTFTNFKEIMYHATQNKKIRQEIKRLVIKEDPVAAKIASFLGPQDIVKLNRLVEAEQDTDSELLFRALFDFGFLIPKSLSNDTLTQLVIPNFETRIEYIKILMRYYFYQYHYGTKFKPKLYDALIDLIPFQWNDPIYKRIFDSVRYTIKYNDGFPITENDFKCVICVTIFSNFSNAVKCTIEVPIRLALNTSALETMPKSLENVNNTKLLDKYMKNNLKEERIDVLAYNENKMAIIFETKFLKDKGRLKKKRLDKMAKEGLSKALLIYEPSLKKYPLNFLNSSLKPKGIVYVVIALDFASRYFSMAFFDRSRDNEPTFINNQGVVTTEKLT